MRKVRSTFIPLIAVLFIAIFAGGCKKESQESTPNPSNEDLKAKNSVKNQPVIKIAEKPNYQKKADDFLTPYNKSYATFELAETSSYWTAANSGKKEDWDKTGLAKLALKKFHSDPKKYKLIKELLTHKKEMKQITVRSLEVAQLAFKGNQLPKDLLEKMVKSEKEIEKSFASFRGKLKGKAYSNNELMTKLKKEKKSSKRKAIWQALKAVGNNVGPKLIALAKIRNEAAKKLGFKNYWYMKIHLQEYDPAKIISLFDELEKLTAAPFKKMKKTLDKEVAKRLRIKPSKMMPWHYNNPFFQSAPPSSKINMDIFYKKIKKEKIIEIAKDFFNSIGLEINDIIAKSDYYERKGKDQNAFCITINRKDDVRTLLNIKPTAKWMDTMLHESGHAVYYKWIDGKLPFNLREAGHILMTEGIAMLFGALGKNPKWLMDNVKVNEKKIKKLKKAIFQQRKREQLIFTRWTLVMLNFEKALYDNPTQDLNKLWWDMVEKFQMVKRPKNRNSADWAAKPHFTIAPVYYHNYMMGELFAAQMRSSLSKIAKHEGSTANLDFKNRKEFGQYFINKIFKPGMNKIWSQLVKDSTGSELSAKAFAKEIK
jgi:peptidyl-dipeptidase A